MPGSTTTADAPEESHVLRTAWLAITSCEMPELCQIGGVALNTDRSVLALDTAVAESAAAAEALPAAEAAE